MPFLHCISSVSELLPSPDTAPWCVVMLHCSCLVSHSSPPKPKRAGEIIKAALREPPPTMAFHPTPVHHLNMASGRFMFITVKAEKQTGWDYKELKVALWGVLRNAHLYLVWTSALLLNIAAYLEGILKKQTPKTKQKQTSKHMKGRVILVQCMSVILMQMWHIREQNEGAWQLKTVICIFKGYLNMGFKSSSSLQGIWTNLNTNLTNLAFQELPRQTNCWAPKPLMGLWWDHVCNTLRIWLVPYEIWLNAAMQASGVNVQSENQSIPLKLKWWLLI